MARPLPGAARLADARRTGLTSNAAEIEGPGVCAPRGAQGSPEVLCVFEPRWADLAIELSASGMAVRTGPVADAVTFVRTREPDVVVVAAESPRRSLRLVADLLEVASRLAIIVVGLPCIEADFLALVQAGAVGYLPGDITPVALARAIRSVARGHTAFPRGLTRALAGAFQQGIHVDGACVQHSNEAELTDREWQVLHLFWQGRSTREIAQRLFISRATVRTHMAAIRRKFGVASTSELLDVLGDSLPPTTSAAS